jgi:hypothetical protein
MFGILRNETNTFYGTKGVYINIIRIGRVLKRKSRNI